MESSKRSLLCVVAKFLGFYTAMFSLFLLVGGYLDLVLWKLVFFNCGHGDIISGCASTMEGTSPNLLGEMDFKWRVVRGHCVGTGCLDQASS